MTYNVFSGTLNPTQSINQPYIYWYYITLCFVFRIVFCAFCFVFCNLQLLFVLLFQNLHVRLIYAIKHLLTYLLKKVRKYATLRNMTC